MANLCPQAQRTDQSSELCVHGRHHPNVRLSARLLFYPTDIVFRYCLATAHIGLVLARLIQGFIVHVNDEGGAILYLADAAQPLNRSKDMIYISVVRHDLIISLLLSKFSQKDCSWRSHSHLALLYGVEQELLCHCSTRYHVAWNNKYVDFSWP